MSLLTLALQQTQHKTWLHYSAEALAASSDMEEVASADKTAAMVAKIKKLGKPVTKAWIIRETGFSERRASHLIDELVRTRRLFPMTSERNRTSWAAKKK